MREDDVSGPEVPGLVGANVIVTDIDPPSAHGIVTVDDRPSGETVIAVFMVAWFTAAATIL